MSCWRGTVPRGVPVLIGYATLDLELVVLGSCRRGAALGRRFEALKRKK